MGWLRKIRIEWPQSVLRPKGYEGQGRRKKAGQKVGGKPANASAALMLSSWQQSRKCSGLTDLSLARRAFLFYAHA
jgi:hypothetical protein